MKSHELLREVFQTHNPKQIAEEMGLSVSMVYKWAEPPEQGSGAANPLDQDRGVGELHPGCADCGVDLHEGGWVFYQESEGGADAVVCGGAGDESCGAGVCGDAFGDRECGGG